MNDTTNLVRLFAPDLEAALAGTVEVLGVTNEAEDKSRALIARADTIKSVTDAQDQDAAAGIARDIRTYVSQVAESRTALTRPLDAVKDRCIEVEREHTGPLVERQKQLERMVADFQVAEQRRVEAEERARRAELDRIERERNEAEAKARKAAERMQTEAGLAKAMAAEQKAADLAQQFQVAVRAPLPEVSKPKGMAVKEHMQWRCDDVRALYAARPELCVVGPKASAIRAVCFPVKGATATNPDTTTVPGLALWWETGVSTRRV